MHQRVCSVSSVSSSAAGGEIFMTNHENYFVLAIVSPVQTIIYNPKVALRFSIYYRDYHISKYKVLLQDEITA